MQGELFLCRGTPMSFKSEYFTLEIKSDRLHRNICIKQNIYLGMTILTRTFSS